MNFKFYVNNSSNNTINKQLSDLIEVDLKIRGEFNILDPIIRLSKVDGLDFTAHNYIAIDDLKRFYFIRQVDNINGKIVTLTLETDLLETYKHEILSSNARVKRQIREGDYIDTSLLTSVKNSIKIHESNVSLVEGETMLFTSIGVI